MTDQTKTPGTLIILGNISEDAATALHSQMNGWPEQIFVANAQAQSLVRRAGLPDWVETIDGVPAAKSGKISLTEYSWPGLYGTAKATDTLTELLPGVTVRHIYKTAGLSSKKLAAQIGNLKRPIRIWVHLPGEEIAVLDGLHREGLLAGVSQLAICVGGEAFFANSDPADKVQKRLEDFYFQLDETDLNDPDWPVFWMRPNALAAPLSTALEELAAMKAMYADAVTLNSKLEQKNQKLHSDFKEKSKLATSRQRKLTARESRLERLNTDLETQKIRTQHAEANLKQMSGRLEASVQSADDLKSTLEAVETKLAIQSKALSNLSGMAHDAAKSTEPVRMIHHFACTGGTMISKCVASLPSTVMFSEIDPLSDLLTAASRFSPTDILRPLRQSNHPVSNEVVVKCFQSALITTRNELQKTNQKIVLRDHAHSRFCAEQDPAAKPTLREMVSDVLPPLSVLTIRHPLDSFLSLDAAGWGAQFPDSFNLEEYARRYSLFLERHDGIPVVLYEDFVKAPHKTLRRICEILDLPFAKAAIGQRDRTVLSGDSGRHTKNISKRVRREVPKEVAKQRSASPLYQELCQRFGYAP